MTCRNCGRPILLDPTGGLVPYYFHTATDSVWCYPIGGGSAELVAEPV